MSLFVDADTLFEDDVTPEWLESKGFTKDFWGSPKRTETGAHYFPEYQTVYNMVLSKPDSTFGGGHVIITWFPKNYHGGNYYMNGGCSMDGGDSYILNPSNMLIVKLGSYFYSDCFTYKGLKFINGEGVFICQNKTDVLSILVIVQEMLEKNGIHWKQL